MDKIKDMYYPEERFEKVQEHTYKCKVCGHEFTPSVKGCIVDLPDRCPSCKVPYISEVE